MSRSRTLSSGFDNEVLVSAGEARKPVKHLSIIKKENHLLKKPISGSEVA